MEVRVFSFRRETDRPTTHIATTTMIATTTTTTATTTRPTTRTRARTTRAATRARDARRDETTTTVGRVATAVAMATATATATPTMAMAMEGSGQEISPFAGAVDVAALAVLAYLAKLGNEKAARESSAKTKTSRTTRRK